MLRFEFNVFPPPLGKDCMLLFLIVTFVCVQGIVSLTSEPTSASAPRMVVGTLEVNGISLQTNQDMSVFTNAVGAIFQTQFATFAAQNASFLFTQSIVVPYFLWFGGSPVAGQEIAASQLRANITDRWPLNGNSAVTVPLSQLCLNMFGVIPSSVAYSTDCGYALSAAPTGWSTPAPSSTAFVDCESSLAFDMTLSTMPSAVSVRNAVASALVLATTDVIINSAVNSTTGSSFTATVQTTAPLSALALLVNRAGQPSQMSFLSVTQISVKGVIVYQHNAIVEQKFDGSFPDCVARLWFLLFLILLAPISYVITSHCYRRGKQRGRLSAREQEEEAKEKAKMMMTHNQTYMQQFTYRPQYPMQYPPQNFQYTN